jgi:hypothetical protein
MMAEQSFPDSTIGLQKDWKSELCSHSPGRRQTSRLPATSGLYELKEVPKQQDNLQAN